MSRDWTPRELHFANKEYNFQNNAIMMTLEKDKEIFLYNPKSDEAKKFPNLYFHISAKNFNILKAFPDSIVETYENILTNLLNFDDNNPNAIYEYTIQNPNNINHIFFDWYIGKLDTNFYYNDENENMLIAEILKDIRTFDPQCYENNNEENHLDNFVDNYDFR